METDRPINTLLPFNVSRRWGEGGVKGDTAQPQPSNYIYLYYLLHAYPSTPPSSLSTYLSYSCLSFSSFISIYLPIFFTPIPLLLFPLYLPTYLLHVYPYSPSSPLSTYLPSLHFFSLSTYLPSSRLPLFSSFLSTYLLTYSSLYTPTYFLHVYPSSISSLSSFNCFHMLTAVQIFSLVRDLLVDVRAMVEGAAYGDRL